MKRKIQARIVFGITTIIGLRIFIYSFNKYKGQFIGFIIYWIAGIALLLSILSWIYSFFRRDWEDEK